MKIIDYLAIAFFIVSTACVTSEPRKYFAVQSFTYYPDKVNVNKGRFIYNLVKCQSIDKTTIEELIEHEKSGDDDEVENRGTQDFRVSILRDRRIFRDKLRGGIHVENSKKGGTLLEKGNTRSLNNFHPEASFMHGEERLIFKIDSAHFFHSNAPDSGSFTYYFKYPAEVETNLELEGDSVIVSIYAPDAVGNCYKEVSEIHMTGHVCNPWDKQC